MTDAEGGFVDALTWYVAAVDTHTKEHTQFSIISMRWEYKRFMRGGETWQREILKRAEGGGNSD